MLVWDKKKNHVFFTASVFLLTLASLITLLLFNGGGLQGMSEENIDLTAGGYGIEPFAYQPLAITGAGCSPDGLLVKVMADDLGFSSSYELLMPSMGDANTLILAPGGSALGMGHAGTDPDSEEDRVQGLIDEAKLGGKSIICIHLGGTARRGELSDRYNQLAAENADLIIVAGAGDDDGFFSNIASSLGILFIQVGSIQEVAGPLEEAVIPETEPPGDPDPGPAPPVGYYGDITGDRQVTVSDVVLAMQSILGLEELDLDQLTAADVDVNGVVDINDVIYLMQYILQLRDTLPVVKPFAEQPLAISGAGGAPDYTLLAGIAAEEGYSFEYALMLEALGDANTLILAPGGSMKGITEGGSDPDTEEERVQSLIDEAKGAGTPVICIHLGGTARRGSLSDRYNRLVAENADLIIVSGHGDHDGFFGNIARDNGTPIFHVSSLQDVSGPLSMAFTDD